VPPSFWEKEDGRVHIPQIIFELGDSRPNNWKNRHNPAQNRPRRILLNPGYGIKVLGRKRK
jgi:hypothetical protein